MRIHRYSLVPFEFLDRETSRRFFTSVSLEQESSLPDELCILADNEIDESAGLSDRDDHHRAIYRMGSACVLVLLHVRQTDKPTFEGALNDLNLRREQHHRLLEAFKSDPPELVADVVSSLNHIKNSRVFGSREFRSPVPSYVFSYSILVAGRNLTKSEDAIVKLHAQPGLLGIEDTPGLRRAVVRSPDVRNDLLAEIKDCDTIKGVRTYCTWATVTSTVESDDHDVFLDTSAILLSLELKLQAAWNKCAVLSDYCDQVAKRRRAGNLGRRLSWLMVGTVDDARTIVNSMASHRINRLFRNIVETSGLEGEILRAERKLGLVNDLLDWERDRQGSWYQRTTETLLLVVAVGQIASLFYDGPVFQQDYGPAAMGVLALLGIAAIWSRRR